MIYEMCRKFADEELAPDGTNQLRQAMEQPAANAWRLPIVDVGEGHEILEALYVVPGVPQVPSIQFWRRSGGRLTSEQGRDSDVPHLRAIFDEDGRPLAGVEVRLVAPEFTEPEGAPLSGRLETRVRTDRDGRFRCRGLHEGEWAVVVDLTDPSWSQLVDVIAGEVVRADFKLDG